MFYANEIVLEQTRSLFIKTCLVVYFGSVNTLDKPSGKCLIFIRQ